MRVGQRNQLPTSSAAGGRYTVVEGDNLSSIAKRHGMDLGALVALNPQLEGRDLNLIHPGEQLELGGASARADRGAAPTKADAKADPKTDAKPEAKTDAKPKGPALGGMGMLGMGGGLAGMGGLGGMGSVKVSDTPGYAALSPALRSKVDGLARDRAAGPALAGLLNSKGFGRLGTDQQHKALDVFRATNPQGRFDLVGLVNREQNGKPVALDRDSKHRTLLDNLHTMATRPPASEISRQGITQAELLQSTMAEANRPGEINQSSKGTCTVTSMQHALTARNPAEYVRLISGLTGPDGEVQLRNGDTLKRDEGSAAPDSATGRSHTERIFQASMMEYSNGALWDYDNASDKSTMSVGSVGRWAASAVGKETEYGGLRVEEMKRGYDALFGTDARLEAGDASKLIRGLEGQKPNTALLALRWGTEGHSAHAVTFEKVENGRVYFRNPWGRNFEMQGTSKDPPPRQVEDGFTGLESMTVAEARQRLFAVIQE